MLLARNKRMRSWDNYVEDTNEDGDRPCARCCSVTVVQVYVQNVSFKITRQTLCGVYFIALCDSV